MIEITSLGIGSNNFGPLSTVAFLVTAGGEQVLVDCGPDTPKMVRKAGHQFVDLSSIVVTHKHLDHMLGVPYLVFGRSVEVLGKKRADPEYSIPPLTIHCSREIESFIVDTLALSQPDFNLEQQRISFDEIPQVAVSKTICDMRFDFVPVDHTVPNVGFVLSSGGQKLLCYTSDMVKGTELIELARGAKVAIVECMVTDDFRGFTKTALHAGVSDASAFLQEVKPEQAFLVHIRPDLMPQAAQMSLAVSNASKVDARYFREGEKIQLR